MVGRWLNPRHWVKGASKGTVQGRLFAEPQRVQLRGPKSPWESIDDLVAIEHLAGEQWRVSFQGRTATLTPDAATRTVLAAETLRTSTRRRFGPVLSGGDVPDFLRFRIATTGGTILPSGDVLLGRPSGVPIGLYWSGDWPRRFPTQYTAASGQIELDMRPAKLRRDAEINLDPTIAVGNTGYVTRDKVTNWTDLRNNQGGPGGGADVRAGMQTRAHYSGGEYTIERAAVNFDGSGGPGAVSSLTLVVPRILGSSANQYACSATITGWGVGHADAFYEAIKTGYDTAWVSGSTALSGGSYTFTVDTTEWVQGTMAFGIVHWRDKEDSAPPGTEARMLINSSNCELQYVGVLGPFSVQAAEVYVAGSQANQVFLAGSQASELYLAGAQAAEAHT